MTKRLVFLIRSLEVGGAEVQLVTLACRLQATTALHVSVVALYRKGPLLKTLEDAGVPVIDVGKRGRWDLFGAARRLISVIRQLRPDILHSYLGPPNLLSAVLRPFLRPRRLYWGVRASDMELDRYDWTWRTVFLCERLLSRIPDRIVVNSFAGREHLLRNGFPAGRLTVIANGIDTTKFQPDPELGMELRREWLDGSAGPLIGLVARLDQMKDHPTFLRAAKMFAAEWPDARFVCVGDGPDSYRRYLDSLSGSLGLDSRRIIWAGGQRDMPAVWNALDVATLCSAYGEGFPNALGEAMACGIPSVTTDVGDAARIVGTVGFIVKCRSPEALAAGWRNAVSLPADERRIIREGGRHRIIERYSVDTMVAETISLYSVEKLAA